MSWAAVASKGIVQDQNAAETTTVDSKSCEEGFPELGAREQSQMALLREALKSRENVITGQRWCLCCGKCFSDIFRLAQHLKDKHNGINGEMEDIRFESNVKEIGQWARITVAKKGKRQISLAAEKAAVVPKTEAPAFSRKESFYQGSTRDEFQRLEKRKEDSAKSREGTKKPKSRLKKAYARAVHSKMESKWKEVVAELEEGIRKIENIKIESLNEMRVLLGLENSKHGDIEGSNMPASRLQILQQKVSMLSSRIEEMKTILEISRNKLKTLNERKLRSKFRKPPILELQQEIHKLELSSMEKSKGLDKIVPSESVDFVCNEIEVSDTQTKCPEITTTSTAVGKHFEREIECNVASDSESESDTSSVSSDDSFDFQWGDTLKSWANNLGVVSLKHVQKENDQDLQVQPLYQPSSMSKPERQKTEELGNQRSKDNVNVFKTVRILSKAARDVPSSQTSVAAVEEVQGMDQHLIQLPSSGSKSCHETTLKRVVDAPEFVPSLGSQNIKICEPCMKSFRSSEQWHMHLKSRQHFNAVSKLAREEITLNSLKLDELGLNQNGELKLFPKCYTGERSDAEEYVTHVITQALNNATQDLVQQLLLWQERTKKFDPMNAKRKKRIVCGIRESTKAIKLQKAQCLIVAPNIQPLIPQHQDAPSGGPTTYPIAEMLQLARKQEIPIIFAMSRKKLGQILGQRKNVSAFAIVDISGAEEKFRMLLSQVQKMQIH